MTILYKPFSVSFMSSLKPITRSVKEVTSKVCQKKFISLGRVLEHWGDIMGDDMGSYTEPSSIKVRKEGRGKQQSFHKTLLISVPPAYSTTLSYRKGMILERINRVLPREGIDDIQFVDSPRSIRKPMKKKKKILNEEEKDYLSSIVDDMEDGEIKERLLSMGQSFLEKED